MNTKLTHTQHKMVDSLNYRSLSSLINCVLPSSTCYWIRCDLVDCFKALKKSGINSLLVEGGANIIQSVLEYQLADQVVVTIRPCFLGGYRSLTHELSQPFNLENTAAASVGGDIVIFGKLQKTGAQAHASRCSVETSATGDCSVVRSEDSPRSLVEFLK